ncbi:MAG: NAD(P)/FAD-dependent oxidoreductase [Candidatus Izemoplasmatales bacterium]
MRYDAIVVGGGIAGLTAASYLGRAGMKTLLCERADHLGGLVVSFERDGFTFDGGIRAFENSGIVKPMLKQLGIEVDLVRSPVSVGIGRDFVYLGGEESIADYEAMLIRQFPEDADAVRSIILEIRKVMGYMDVLYGIDNPLFLDAIDDPKYVFKTLLPWLFRYNRNIRKAGKLTDPIDDHLSRFTTNKALIGMITQHFFRETPAFFALSYFSLYLDYNYPRGGTGTLVRAVEKYARDHGVEIRTGTEIVALDPAAKTVATAGGEILGYDRLVWAGDMKAMYRAIPEASLSPAVRARKQALEGLVGGDSIFTVYLSVDADPSEFARVCGAHSFYSPVAEGILGKTADRIDPSLRDASGLPVGLAEYFQKTTYEISIPVLRDPALAPAGRTGLIVSVLMDYRLVERIKAEGLYEEFKKRGERLTVDALVGGAFPMLEGRISGIFSSTPLSIARDVGSYQGAITGWSFTNRPMPVEHGFASIQKTVMTPLPDVYQAGQWTFAPSGLPVSILTGKLAADAVLKRAKKTRRAHAEKSR